MARLGFPKSIWHQSRPPRIERRRSVHDDYGAGESRLTLRKRIGVILIVSGWIVYLGTTSYIVWLILTGHTPSFLKEYTLGTNAGWVDDWHYALGGYGMVQRIQRSIVAAG